jgi:hypothetical protein
MIFDLDNLPVKGRERKLEPESNFMYLKSVKLMCDQEFEVQTKPIINLKTQIELPQIETKARSISRSLEGDNDEMSDRSNINRSRTLEDNDFSIQNNKVYFY